MKSIRQLVAVAVAVAAVILGGCNSLSDPEPGSAKAAEISTTTTFLETTTTTIPEETSTTGTTAVASTRPVTKPPTTTAAAAPTFPPAPPTTKPTAGTGHGLGQPFTLRVGETAGVGSDGLTVKFAALLGDSRCPPNVQCIWAGNARIAIEVAEKGSSSRLELNTFEGNKTVYFNSYLFELRSLSPASSAAESEYRATLVVTRG